MEGIVIDSHKTCQYHPAKFPEARLWPNVVWPAARHDVSHFNDLNRISNCYKWIQSAVRTAILVLIPFTVAKLGDLRRISTQIDKKIVRPCILEMEYLVNGIFQLQLALIRRKMSICFNSSLGRRTSPNSTHYALSVFPKMVQQEIQVGAQFGQLLRAAQHKVVGEYD
jgi:hypothetical protein